MKKSRLLIIVIICISLASCSNEHSPLLNENDSKLNENDTNMKNQRLNNLIEMTEPSPQTLKNEEKTTKNLPDSVSGDHTSTSNNDNLVEAEFDDNKKTNTKISNKPLLATYSSKVYTKTEDRQKNLKIVCEKLSGTILGPNEEFSYNDTCGPYNKENGFGKATVFLSDGTEIQDYGGGVCQLSSTLYNAIKNLNVEITERHKHSKKVYYVPDGQDATVSYGNLDFKCKNLNDYSLFIEAFSNADKVQVNIYKT